MVWRNKDPKEKSRRC